MRKVTAREANQRFAAILTAVERGENVLITKRGEPVAVMLRYHPTALTSERRALIDRAIAVMDEPVEITGEFRAFTRDEMHPPE